MFAMSEKSSKDYHEPNTGVHRIRPKNISAPALIWHRAFWSIPNNLVKKVGDPKKIATARKSKNNLLIDIYRSLHTDSQREGSHCENVDIFPKFQDRVILFGLDVSTKDLDSNKKIDFGEKEKEDIFSNAPHAVSLEFKWDGLSYTIRCQLYEEFVTFTYFAEFDQKVAGLKFEQKLDSCRDEYFKYKFGIALRYITEIGRKQSYESTWSNIGRFHFIEFWNYFQRNYLF